MRNLSHLLPTIPLTTLKRFRTYGSRTQNRSRKVKKWLMSESVVGGFYEKGYARYRADLAAVGSPDVEDFCLVCEMLRMMEDRR